MPGAAAALSFPGCERASLTSSPTLLTFIDVGIDTEITTTETLTTGVIFGPGSVVISGCWYGSVVNTAAGPIHSV